MSQNRKRPGLGRLLLSLIIGILISGGALVVMNKALPSNFSGTAFSVPYLTLAAISAVLIALFLFIPAKKPWRVFKWLGRLVVLVIVVSLVWGGGLVYLMQNVFIYYPGIRDVEAENVLKENPAVDAIALSAEHNTQYTGYFWKASPGRAGLILYFGGNGEIASTRVRAMTMSDASILLQGYHFMMMDYPGYGQSGGETTENRIHAMAKAALAYARSREDVNPDKIVLVGWSLGTGVAGKLAAEEKPAALVLMAPFYNGTELANSFLKSGGDKLPSFLTKLPGFLVRNKFPNDMHARNTTVPVLVLAGLTDTTIPYEQAQRLEALFPQGDLITLEGGHGAPWLDSKSLQALAAFLQTINGGNVTPLN